MFLVPICAFESLRRPYVLIRDTKNFKTCLKILDTFIPSRYLLTNSFRGTSPNVSRTLHCHLQGLVVVMWNRVSCVTKFFYFNFLVGHKAAVSGEKIILKTW